MSVEEVEEGDVIDALFSSLFLPWNLEFRVTFPTPIDDQRSPSYRNQPIDLLYKLIDWFLFDGEHWTLMG